MVTSGCKKRFKGVLQLICCHAAAIVSDAQLPIMWVLAGAKYNLSIILAGKGVLAGIFDKPADNGRQWTAVTLDLHIVWYSKADLHLMLC